METTIMGYVGYILGLYRDNGEGNGNYYSIWEYVRWTPPPCNSDYKGYQ